MTSLLAQKKPKIHLNPGSSRGRKPKALNILNPVKSEKHKQEDDKKQLKKLVSINSRKTKRATRVPRTETNAPKKKRLVNKTATTNEGNLLRVKRETTTNQTLTFSELINSGGISINGSVSNGSQPNLASGYSNAKVGSKVKSMNEIFRACEDDNTQRATEVCKTLETSLESIINSENQKEASKYVKDLEQQLTELKMMFGRLAQEFWATRISKIISAHPNCTNLVYSPEGIPIRRPLSYESVSSFSTFNNPFELTETNRANGFGTIVKLPDEDNPIIGNKNSGTNKGSKTSSSRPLGPVPRYINECKRSVTKSSDTAILFPGVSTEFATTATAATTNRVENSESSGGISNQMNINASTRPVGKTNPSGTSNGAYTSKYMLRPYLPRFPFT